METATVALTLSRRGDVGMAGCVTATAVLVLSRGGDVGRM